MKIKAITLTLLAASAGVLSWVRWHEPYPSDLRDAVADSREFDTSITALGKDQAAFPIPKASISVVPGWFKTSGLAFVMIRKTETGGFTAILRSGFFTTSEMGIFVEGGGKTTADFTEYAANPMAAPKNKAEVMLTTRDSRKEIALMLREVQEKKPVVGDMKAALDSLLSFLESSVASSSWKAILRPAEECPQGYDRSLSCLADPRPGDNALVSRMYDGIDVCVKDKRAALALRAEGTVHQAIVDKIIVRAGGIEYKVDEPKLNFIVGTGTGPGRPRHGTLQMFLGSDTVEAGFICMK